MSAVAWSSRDVMRTAPRQVLLSAWQANRSRGSMWFRGLMVFAVLADAVTSAWILTPIALLVAWSMLVSNVLLQNDPHTARLLPAQVPVLRNTLLGMAALLCITNTLLSWLLGRPVLVTAAGTAFWLVLFAWWQRWPWLGGPLAITFIWALPALRARGDLESVVWLWHAAPEILTLLALVLSALALRAVVMTGGARHERYHARLQKTSAAMRGQVSVQGYTSQPLGVSKWVRALLWGEIAYAAWMAHVLRSQQQSVGRRLALGLGPRAHWTSLLAVQGIVLLVVPLLAVYTNYQGTGQAMGNVALIAITMIGLIGVTQQLPIALWASRREQALLCLLPGAPRGAKLNQWLARLLAATAMGPLVLLALVLLILGPVAHTDAFGGKNGDMALSLLVFDTPWVLLLLRDWARAPAPVGRAPGLLFVAMTLAFGLAFAGVYWLFLPWYALAALTLLVMLPLGRSRWQVISRAPTAWPVGRLG
jgi:hypothetical protein